jgi:hypothetical protein
MIKVKKFSRCKNIKTKYWKTWKKKLVIIHLKILYFVRLKLKNKNNYVLIFNLTFFSSSFF